jgi:peptidyl-prolyl cis-trans isomerase C
MPRMRAAPAVHVEVHVKPLALILSVAVLALACRNNPAPPPASSTAALPPVSGTAPGIDVPPPAGDTGGVRPVPAELPEVLARVNGEAVERWEFEYMLRGLESQAGRPVPAERRDEIFRGVLDELVAYRLLAQEAQARRIAVPDADVKARVDQVRKNFASEDAFRKALADEGLSLEQLQQRAGRDVLVSRILEAEIGPRIAVRPADIETFYQQNLDRFKESETVHASHILVAIPEKADAAARQKLRTQAEDLLAQVRAGADFAQLARSRSHDTSSAARGGDLGFFAMGQMDPAFAKAAFALKPGETSPVVETPYGFHVIRVLERRPARTVPLAEVRSQVEQYLTSERRDELTVTFVEQLKAKGRVEMYV